MKKPLFSSRDENYGRLLTQYPAACGLQFFDLSATLLEIRS